MTGAGLHKRRTLITGYSAGVTSRLTIGVEPAGLDT